MDPIEFKTSKGRKRTNSHFTICGFPKKARKSALNASSFHTFFFDVDMKQNENCSKHFIQTAIREIWGMFDFVVETRNGYHLYILRPEGKYLPSQAERFIADWKERKRKIELSTGLQLDNVCDLSRIAKIPGCWHKKDGDTTEFQIKLLKGANLLGYNGEKQIRLINAIPIGLVLEKLGVRTSGDGIYWNGELSSGWKVNPVRNYVNDFSHHGERPIGGPFVFALRRFRNRILIKEPGIEESKLKSKAKSETYAFFADHFGIMPVKAKDRKIPIPIPIEKLLSDPKMPGKDAKLALGFFKAANRKFENASRYGKMAEMTFSEFVDACSMAERPDELATYLEGYEKRIPKLYGNPIIRFQTEKRSGEWRISFSVLPDSAFGRGLNKESAYGQHYVNSAVMLLPTNGVSIRFYLFLCSRLISPSSKIDLELRKTEILRFFGNANFRRNKRAIRKIADTTKDFRFKSVKYGIVFGKGVLRKPSNSNGEKRLVNSDFS